MLTGTEEQLRQILADTLGKTGYAFLASRIAAEENFGAVMMDAMTQAFELGEKQGHRSEAALWELARLNKEFGLE